MKKMSWTLGVPIQNLRSFVAARPPLVVFSVCLATLGIVSLGLGIFVKHTTSPLKNFDEMSWNDISAKFSKLEFCTQPSDITQSYNTTGMEAISVPFEMEDPIPEVWKNYTLISGSVATADLGLYDYPGTNVSFSFSLMKPENKICMNLYHPTAVKMPKVISSCNSLQFNPFPKSIGAYVLPREEKIPSAATRRCSETQHFGLKLLENPQWTVYLEEEDRKLVSLHLLATSAFLMAVFFSLICYAAVRGGFKLRPSKLEEPLSSL